MRFLIISSLSNIPNLPTYLTKFKFVIKWSYERRKKMNYANCLLLAREQTTAKTSEKDHQSSPQKVTSWRSNVVTNQKKANSNTQNSR